MTEGTGSYNILLVAFLRPFAPLPPPLPFEKLCMSAKTIPHSISVLYGMLQGLEHKGKPIYIREWERDLQDEFTEIQLDHLYRLTHSSSLDKDMQENVFKLLT